MGTPIFHERLPAEGQNPGIRIQNTEEIHSLAKAQRRRERIMGSFPKEFEDKTESSESWF
jgi:hypothetical protein